MLHSQCLQIGAFLFAPRRAKDFGPGPLCEIDRGQSDTAGSGMETCWNQPPSSSRLTRKPPAVTSTAMMMVA